MMSHALPNPVCADLRRLVVGLEDTLQAEGHKVAAAIGESAAFDEGWVEASLTRALIARSAATRAAASFRVDELGQGGVELAHVYSGVERQFRLRRGRRDKYGFLQVLVNSDSILTNTARTVERTLFDPEPPVVGTNERWVLAYLLNPATRTLAEVKAGRVTGLATSRPPYRLKLEDVVEIPFAAETPPSFPGSRDDLFPDEREDEGGAEETG